MQQQVSNNSVIDILVDENHTTHIRLKLLICALTLPHFRNLPFKEAALRVTVKPGENLEEDRVEKIVQTNFRAKSHLEWEEQFCLDCCWEDELQLTLIDDKMREIPITILPLRPWHKIFNKSSFQIKTVFDIREKFPATLSVFIKLYERMDMIGGLQAPKLSLALSEQERPYVQRLSEQQRIERMLVPKMESNCFSYMDGGVVSGFNEMELFPPKFRKSRRQQ